MRGRTVKIKDLEFTLKIEHSKSKYTYAKLKGDAIIIRTSSNNINDILPILFKKLENLKLDLLPKEAFEEFLIFGAPYKLHFKNIKRKYLIFHKRKRIILNPKYKTEFIDYLIRLLLKYANRKITRLVNLLGINSIPKLKIKILRSKYGYILNDTLYLSLINIFFPKYIIDYILAHEVIHLRVPGHNYKFKRLLSIIYPDYKEVEQDLKRWTIAVFYNKRIHEIIEI